MLHGMPAPDTYGQLGFIGLGAMGLPMARNLVGAGARVGLTGRTPAKALAQVRDGQDAADGAGADVVSGAG